MDVAQRNVGSFSLQLSVTLIKLLSICPLSLNGREASLRSNKRLFLHETESASVSLTTTLNRVSWCHPVLHTFTASSHCVTAV